MSVATTPRDQLSVRHATADLAANKSPRLSRHAAALMNELSATVLFSAVSIVEVAIKFAQGRSDFTMNPETLRGGLLTNDYQELS